MAGKNVLVITGSPRIDGNGDRLADAFIDGAVAADNDIVRFDAGRMNIGPCKACDTCFTRDGACSVSNGFNTIAPEIEKSDVIVFVTPMYWFSFTAQIKSVIDKMYSFCSAGKDITGKECILIACGATEEEKEFEGLTTTYKIIADYLNWTDKGILIAKGVNNKGDIKNTEFLKKAEEMGKNI